MNTNEEIVIKNIEVDLMAVRNSIAMMEEIMAIPDHVALNSNTKMQLAVRQYTVMQSYAELLELRMSAMKK